MEETSHRKRKLSLNSTIADDANMTIDAPEQEEEDKRLLETVLKLAAKKSVSGSINWATVASALGEQYEADSVHARFSFLTAKVRKTRSMEEVVNDALKLIGMPLRPSSAYMLFLEKFRKKNPKVHPVELMKRGGIEWTALKESKKERFVKKAQVLKEKYTAQLKDWNERHPEGTHDLSLNGPSKVVDGHQKTRIKSKKRKIVKRPAFEYYSDKKKESFMKKHPNLTVEQLNAKLMRRWDRMADEKRQTFEKMAVEDYERKKLRSMSGYLIFCMENRRPVQEENKELTGAEVTRRLGAMWNSLGEEEKEHFRSRAKEAQSNPSKT